MNRKQFLEAAGLLSLMSVLPAARAAEPSTPAQAEALVRKAVEYIKKNGAEKGYEEISNGKLLKDRDMYVFVYDLSGKCLAHGANPKLIGKDLIGMKDPDGKPLIQILVDVAKSKGHGWTETVKFRNPVTDKIQLRRNYIERLGDTAIGSGVFID